MTETQSCIEWSNNEVAVLIIDVRRVNKHLGSNKKITKKNKFRWQKKEGRFKFPNYVKPAEMR